MIQAHLASYFPLGMADADRRPPRPGRASLVALVRALARRWGCPRAVPCPQS